MDFLNVLIRTISFFLMFRAYGNDVSLSARARERTVKSMESKADAIARTAKQKAMIAAGTKRAHCHVGPTESYRIDDLEGCLEKVNLTLLSHFRISTLLFIRTILYKQ